MEKYVYLALARCILKGFLVKTLQKFLATSTRAKFPVHLIYILQFLQKSVRIWSEQHK
jgi:hypothetical protein